MTRPGQLVCRIALIAGALALATAVVRSMLPAIFSTAPQLALRVAPADPDANYRLAAIRYATKPGRLPDAAYRSMFEAARRAPLSADPFAILATRAIADGEGAQATLLLEEARRRNPRQRLARALLVQRYIRENRPVEASTEVAVLHRLVPEANKLLVDAMTGMAMEPQGTAAVAQALRGDELLGPLLTNLISRGASTDTVLQLARGWRPTGRDGDEGLWRAKLLDRLVTNGEYDRARRLWSTVGGGDVMAAKGALFNGQFAALPALPPFNWRLTSDETGVAEIGRGHRLTVEYPGRRSGMLASQLLLLAPGTYRLGVVAEGSATGQGSRLGWFVRCAAPGKAADQGRVLLTTAITGLSGPPRQLSADFTVPPDACRAQWLSLEGIAAEFPTTQSVEFSRLSLTPAGAR